MHVFCAFSVQQATRGMRVERGGAACLCVCVCVCVCMCVVCVCVCSGRRVLNTFLIDLSLICLRVEYMGQHISQHIHLVNRELF